MKKKILIGVGVFVAFLAIVIVSVLMATGKERDLATQFVQDISNNRNSSAYNLFSDSLKGVQDQATFNSQVATLKLDRGCNLEVTGVEASTSTDNGTSKEVTGTVKCSGKSYNAIFAFDGESKLLGYSIRP